MDVDIKRRCKNLRQSLERTQKQWRTMTISRCKFLYVYVVFLISIVLCSGFRLSSNNKNWILTTGGRQQRPSSSIAVASKETTTTTESEQCSDYTAQTRDRWWEDEYWYNESIHTFGNTGLLGGLHAAMAPLSTKIIDLLAYRGENAREKVRQRAKGRTQNTTI